MSEVRIKARFGEVIIPYTNQGELEQGLADVENVIRLVESRVSRVVPSEPRRPKAGYEDIYTFTTKGQVELLVAPTSRGEVVGLVLFAYDPERIGAEALEKETGIDRVVSAVLSHPYYKEYFARLDKGTYCPSPDGRSWIVNEVVPLLRKKAERGEIESEGREK